MNNDARKALWNSAELAAKLKPGQSITREELICTLQRPLPKLESGQFYPSDQDIGPQFQALRTRKWHRLPECHRYLFRSSETR